MKLTSNIFENIITDWKKKTIEPEERQLFIKEYLKQENITMRELGRRLNINYSTLQDWTSLRQKNKSKKEHTNIYFLADRLTFLLSQKNSVDERTLRKLEELKNEIIKIRI